MRNHFNEQLSQLHIELVKMGALCEEGISLTAKALEERGEALLARVPAIEQEIDRKEREIEALCMRMLLRQQPVARDLRTISSALRMISDMERIGDQAADIAEIVRGGAGQLPCPLRLRDMARAAICMVTDSIDAYVNADLDMAHAVMRADDTVDDHFVQMRDELIAAIRRDSAEADRYLDLLMIAKYLERIGDHAVNIAEWVEYAITGMHPEDAEALPPLTSDPRSIL